MSTENGRYDVRIHAPFGYVDEKAVNESFRRLVDTIILQKHRDTAWCVKMIPLLYDDWSRWPNVCMCHCYPWAHHRGIGMCGQATAAP